MVLPAARRRHARRIVGAALLALLLSQWLAFAHAVLHAAQPRPSLTFAVVEAVQTDAFGHAAATPECRLVDQLLSATPVPPAELTIAVAAPEPSVVTRGRGLHGAAERQPYQARAPPRA